MALEEQRSEMGNIHSPLHSDGYQVTDPLYNADTPACACIGKMLDKNHKGINKTQYECVCVRMCVYVPVCGCLDAFSVCVHVGRSLHVLG